MLTLTNKDIREYRVQDLLYHFVLFHHMIRTMSTATAMRGTSRTTNTRSSTTTRTVTMKTTPGTRRMTTGTGIIEDN